MALLASAAASAQTGSPTDDGYMARAAAMYAAGNFTGCLDQLSAVDRDALPADTRERAAWLRAAATFRTSRARALPLLRAFTADYPWSTHRQEALARTADCLLPDDPARALEIYLGIDPRTLTGDDRADLLYNTAYGRLRTGDTARALQGFLGLTSDPRLGSDARYYAGYIYYTRGDYDRAAPLLESVDTGSALRPFADFHLAQTAYMTADYTRAARLAHAARAEASLPADYHAEALRIEGEALHNSGKRAAAMTLLRRYVAETPDAALSALYLVGLDDYRAGHLDEAVGHLRRVTADSAVMGQTAYLYIGEALMKQGDPDAAILAFDNARRMDHDTAVTEAATYNYAVARAAGASVPFAAGVDVFEDYLRRFPSGAYAPTVQEYIVKGYLTEKNYDAALASIERMQRPSDAVLAAKQQILYALGSRALATGDTDAAARFLERSRELARFSPAVAAQTALTLGEARYRQGRHQEAVGLLNEYLRATPETDVNRPLARYDLGYARLALKDYADAAVNFEKVAAAPGQLSEATVADALSRLGDTYYYRSDWDAAEKAYDRAYAKNHAAGDYPLFQKAVMQGYRRRHTDKIESLRRMMADFPTSSLMPDAMLELTESYQQLGRPDDAIATYRRLAEQYPATVQGRRARLQLALTLLNTGKRAEAAKTYRSVISLYPTSEEARMAADELKRMAADDGTLPEFAAFLATVENGPRLDVAEADRLDFEAAEKIWLTEGKPARLARYLSDRPDGSFRPRALAYMAEASADTPAQALRYTAEILERYPDSPVAEQALEASARARWSLGQGEEALADWTVLRGRASTPAALNAARAGIMRVARDMGRHDLMLTAADELLATSANGSEIRTEAIFTRGLAHSMAGDTAAARRDWAEIADDTDDIYGTKAAYYLAESLFSGPSPDLKAARDRLEALIDSATPHTYWLARAFILLSDIHAAEGRRFEAREYLRSLRENYPGDEPDIMQMIDTRLSKLK